MLYNSDEELADAYVMEYEIWYMEADGNVGCLTSVLAKDIDAKLAEYAKRWPNKKFFFGQHIHIRQSVNGKIEKGWT